MRSDHIKYDVKLHRTFLKRTKYDLLKLDDVHIGGSIQVYSRALAIKDYADEFTRKRLVVKKERFVTVQHFVPTRMRLTAPSPRSVEYALQSDSAARESLTKSISDRTVLVVELEKPNATSHLSELIRSKWPGECYSTSSMDGAAVVCTGIVLSEYWLMFMMQNQQLGQTFFAPEAITGLKRTARLENTTLCVVKPHAFHKGYVGKIIDSILRGGFLITDVELVTLERVSADEFLEIYKGVIPDYQSLVDEMTSGPCIAFEIAHHPGVKHSESNIVKSFRDFVGPSDPEIARQIRPQSPRALFGVNRVQNAVHCTDLPDDGKLETEYFFNLLL
ncbi:Nucleoside diphosphate kinase 7 [Gonapodya sp. JEL0774]|nr:Nucleoside diphosphate kinase 7 [Gonapodya sp. JEL0774]